MPVVHAAPQAVHARHRPEETTLYEVVGDNLETPYAAVDEGALSVGLPSFVRKELDGYLDCGLLCRGFGRLRCEACHESHLVTFSCKGRGFCPSCLGWRMASTAANLIERVLPPSPLRQWVLTVPFAWRARLAYDGELLGAVTRVCVRTILGFYAARMKREGVPGGQSGAVVVAQRTSSHLKLNPHLHVLFLDGVYREQDVNGRDSPSFTALPHLSTRDVGEALETICKRVVKQLRRRGLLGDGERALEPEAEAGDGLSSLAASAVSGQSPPAGPEWRRRRLPALVHAPLGFEPHHPSRRHESSAHRRALYIEPLPGMPVATSDSDVGLGGRTRRSDSEVEGHGRVEPVARDQRLYVRRRISRWTLGATETRAPT